MQEAIAIEMKKTRMRNLFKREDIAKKLNVSAETIRRYETDCSGLTVEKMEKLLNIYNVDRLIFFTNVCAYIHNKET